MVRWQLLRCTSSSFSWTQSAHSESTQPRPIYETNPNCGLVRRKVRGNASIISNTFTSLSTPTSVCLSLKRTFCILGQEKERALKRRTTVTTKTSGLQTHCGSRWQEPFYLLGGKLLRERATSTKNSYDMMCLSHLIPLVLLFWTRAHTQHYIFSWCDSMVG